MLGFDMLGKTLTDQKEEKGEILQILWDNVARQCLLKTAEGVFAAQDVADGKKIAAKLQPTQDTHANPIKQGMAVFDTNGKSLGEVDKLKLTKKLTLRSLQTTATILKPSQIWAVGDIVVVKEKSAKQIEQEKQRKTTPNTKAVATTVATHKTAADASTDEKLTAERQNTVQEDEKIPAAETNTPHGNMQKRYGDFNYLIGKTVDKTVVNFQGEVMIKKDGVVTREVLRQAKISGKLLELYLHIK